MLRSCASLQVIPFSIWELQRDHRHANRVVFFFWLGVWQPVIVQSARGRAADGDGDGQSAALPRAEWQRGR